MICPICQQNFTQRRLNQKYCSSKCCQRAQDIKKHARAKNHTRWKKAWVAWKRDFALGKTQSNL